MFRKEVKKKGKILIQDFQEKKLRAEKRGSKLIKVPYMCLGSKVTWIQLTSVDKEELDESPRTRLTQSITHLTCYIKQIDLLYIC